MGTRRYGPDWDLKSDPGPAYNTYGYSLHGNPLWVMPCRSAHWKLSIDLTLAQVEQLLHQVRAGRRGDPVFSYPAKGVSRVTDLQVTEAEADEIRAGTHPLDVLFPVWPELGYRLVAVTDMGVT
jgi:hypothetical protein